MIQHHRPHLVRSALARVAITGTASIATIIAVAPVAIAAPGDEVAPAESSETTVSEEGETSPADPVEETDPSTEEPPAEPVDETSPPTEETEAEEPAPAKAEVAAADPIDDEEDIDEEDVTPDFGFQKFRVGVQLADGAYAPDASTVGSKIEITISGEVKLGGILTAAPPSQTYECVTDESTVEEGSTASYCLGELLIPPGGDRSTKGAVAQSVNQYEEEIPEDQAFLLFPGQTATFTQLTAGDGLIKSDETSVIEPCEPDEVEPGDIGIGICLSGPMSLKSTSVLFDNFGPPPIANDDKITATAGDPTTINVVTNDDTVNGAPVESIEVIDGPQNGTAKVSGSKVVYTSDDDFDGTDTFDYRLTTGNGSDTATVTIVVEPDGILPDTGAPNNSLLGYGALMLAGGGWLVAQGRRREDALVD